MKIAVIGAGICGLYLAWKLSEKGHQITVFEKKKDIGKEACSGLFSERIFTFVPESKKLVQNKIDFVLIHFPQKTIRVDFSKPFFVMSHAELDRLVADLARKGGAEILTNSPAVKIPGSFDIIIGADGARSFIRKHLQLREPEFYSGIQGFVRSDLQINFVEAWPQKGGGFIWKIPRGNEIEYGIMANPKTSRELFDGFLEREGIRPERFVAWLIPQGLTIPKNEKITLCGDAAGMTKPWSGGGVIWGLTAANILLKHFPDLLAYQRAVKAFFLPKIFLGKIATKLIYFLGFNLPFFMPSKTSIESDYLI